MVSGLVSIWYFHIFLYLLIVKNDRGGIWITSILVEHQNAIKESQPLSPIIFSINQFMSGL